MDCELDYHCADSHNCQWTDGQGPLSTLQNSGNLDPAPERGQ